jgi:signal transduction histidine kinase
MRYYFCSVFVVLLFAIAIPIYLMNTNFARYFLPPHIVKEPNADEYWKALLCSVSLVLTIGLTLPAVLLYAFVLYNALFLKMTLVILLINVAFLAVLRLTTSFRTTFHMVIIWQYVMLFGVTFVMGGISSVVAATLFSPALLALVLLGYSAMWSMLGVAIVGICGLTLLALAGIQMPPQYPIAIAPIINGFVNTTIIISILASFYYFDRVRKQSYKALQKERQALQEERDSVQQRVHEATNNLEDQNTTLQKALQDVEAANMLKSEFLRNISHEIRTPLTAILGFSEILSERLEYDTENRPLIDHITQAGTNLLGIFSNILTLSQIDAGETNYERSLVGTRFILDHVCNVIKPKAHIKGLECVMELDGSVPENILIDGTHTQQILVYLCDNAVKFTEHGEVRLFVRFVGGASPRLVCEVSDTGIGIAPEFLDRLFIPFHQQDGSKTRAFGGLGLGMAITKRLLDSLGGTIAIQSEVGKGSTFTVEIPCALQE